MDYINAFWVGGAICALVQILMEKTKMLPGRIMVMLVCLGASYFPKHKTHLYKMVGFYIQKAIVHLEMVEFDKYLLNF